MGDGEHSSFDDLVGELADGERWKLVRAESWEEFAERLSTVIVDVEPRRRQALVMMLLALVDGGLSSEELKQRLDAEDVDSDAGVEALVSWLRHYRPRRDP